jgi:hypothetical protein
MSEYVRMTIAVPKDAYNRLRESAQREMRQPRQQAHWLLYKALGVEPDANQSTNANRASEVFADPSTAAR